MISSGSKLRSSLKNLNSSDSQGKEAPRVSMHDENADTVSDGDGDGDASLVDDSVSSDEARVSDDATGIKNEDESSKNVGVVPTADYDSMLSMFDDYAANGKSHRVGHGYEVGDMVWGKVKSHPWWPGHIFSEAFATTSVRKTKSEGHVLVAFFGDSSYGWFDPAELIPFELNFAEKSRQTGSRMFVKAVDDAVDELNRRHGLGLACRCRNPYSFRPTKVEGYLAVEFADSEGVFSVSQIKRARDNFVPGGMLGFLKELALKPMNNEPWDIDFIQNKATVLAFRKAVYEEFDETYAQAFGAQSVRQAPTKASLEPSRAPLSGRLVFAEALGKRKSSGKPRLLSKSKDETEKDKYHFKRRNEPGHERSSTSSQPSQTDDSDLPVKKRISDVVHAASHSTLPDVAVVAPASQDQPASDQFHANEPVHDNLSEKHNSGVAEKKLSGDNVKVKTDWEFKKSKVRKRALGDMDSESSVAMKKTKKRKKDLVMEAKSNRTEIPGADGNCATLVGKIREQLPSSQVDPVREDLQVNHQGNEVARYPMVPDSLEAKPVNDSQVDLPQLLDGLRALALNPFHGAKSNSYVNVSQVFMKFRSLVFLKSPSNEPKEARPSMLPSLPRSSDNNTNEKVMPSVKTPKPLASLDDSTKGGSKRAPSDRLEQVAVKRKRINDVKLLAAKKRAALKVPEANKVDGKDTVGKVISQTVERKTSQKTSDVQQVDGKEVARKPVATTPARVLGSEPARKKDLPAKASSPTMLVMKFPAEASLPSSAELRAKFARFGSMDYKATRIFYSSHTCRVVYNLKSDAQAALNFASTNFGNINVKCYLRERDVETPEAESTKVQVDDSHIGTPQSRDLSVPENRQSLQQNTQLKSCLRRPSGEDGISTAGGVGGNGNGKGRVKFMLGGGEGSSRTNGDDNIESSHGLNYNTDKFHMVVPPPTSSSSTTIPVPSQFPFAPNNFPQTEIQPRNLQNHLAVPRAPPSIDIRQPMMSLLCRCEGILKSLKGSLGYVPYHL